METYLTQITNYLLAQSWQIAILAAVIAAVTLALNNKSAHVRYLLWLIVLAKCLVPPLLSIPVAVLPEERPAVIVTMLDRSVAEPSVRPVTPVAAAQAPTIVERPARFNSRQWLVFGWVMGVAVFVLFAVIKALRTNSWLRLDRKALPAELKGGIEDLFSNVGVKSFPKVWLIDGIGQPFVWGLLRGSIYLPANFLKVDNAEHRRVVLGHELSHILRFDATVNLLQVIAQAIFWFHPFVWWTNKKIRSEREKCCDEMAIARLGAKAKEYSSAIVNILISEQESTRSVPSLAVAGPVKNIEERIKTMLRPGKKFCKHPSLPVAVIVVLTVLLSVPTSIVLTAKAADQGTTESADVGRIFGDPTNLGPTVNSPSGDWDPDISADGLSLYFQSYRPGSSGKADLWITSRKTTSDPWAEPVNLGLTVNSSANDNAPSISADGLSLYFSSGRSGGHGDRDLWVTTRSSTSDPWGIPVNLGPTVNSYASDHAPSISADGLALYFSEHSVGPKRPGGLGSADIWMTTRKTKADPWSTPVNLGSTINTSGFEGGPCISADGLTLYFCRPQEGKGIRMNELWATTRRTKGDTWGNPVNLGSTVNSPDGSNFDPDISYDGSTLYLSSSRPSAIGGSGDFDIWQVSLKSPGAKE